MPRLPPRGSTGRKYRIGEKKSTNGAEGGERVFGPSKSERETKAKKYINAQDSIPGVKETYV